MFRLTSKTEHVRTLSRFCLWSQKQTRIEKVVRPPACAWRKVAGVGKTPIGAFKALVELLDAHPGLPGGAPPDDETYDVWVESDNSDRSSRCVENHGSKRRQEPRSVYVALGAEWGSYQANRAGNLRVANPLQQQHQQSRQHTKVYEIRGFTFKYCFFILSLQPKSKHEEYETTQLPHPQSNSLNRYARIENLIKILPNSLLEGGTIYSKK